MKGLKSLNQGLGYRVESGQDAPLLWRLWAPVSEGPLIDSVDDARCKADRTGTERTLSSGRLAASPRLDYYRDLDDRDLAPLDTT